MSRRDWPEVHFLLEKGKFNSASLAYVVSFLNLTHIRDILHHSQFLIAIEFFIERKECNSINTGKVQGILNVHFIGQLGV